VSVPHPPEFRRRAIELARVGERPIAAVAKHLSISESCLRNWLAQAVADERGSDSRLTSAEKRELSALRRDTRRVEMENEILNGRPRTSPGKMSSQISISTGPRNRRRHRC
jgi:transposase